MPGKYAYVHCTLLALLYINCAIPFLHSNVAVRLLTIRYRLGRKVGQNVTFHIADGLHVCVRKQLHSTFSPIMQVVISVYINYIILKHYPQKAYLASDDFGDGLNPLLHGLASDTV